MPQLTHPGFLMNPMGAKTPLSIFGSNLVAYYHAETSIITEIAGGVSQIDDKTANGNDKTAGAGQEPAYTANAQNGKHGITYNGVSDALTVADNPTIDLVSTLTFFIVFKVLTYTNADVMLAKTQVGTVGWQFGTHFGAAALMLNIDTSAAANQQTLVANGGDLNPHYLICSIDDPDITINMDGGADITNTYSPGAGLSTTNELSSGARLANGAGALNVEKYEWGLINAVPTAAQKAALEAYFASEWAI